MVIVAANAGWIIAVETLEKMARAMDMHLYQLLYDGPEPPPVPKLRKASGGDDWGSSEKDARFSAKLRSYLSQMTPGNRSILMALATQRLKEKKRRS